MNSALEGLGIRIFDIVEGPLKDIIDGFTKFIGSLDAETLKSYALGLGLLTPALGLVAVGIRGGTAALIGFRTAMISTGIGALVVALGVAASHLIKMTGVFKDVTNAAGETTKEIGKQQVSLNVLARSLMAANKEEKIKIREEDKKCKGHINVSRNHWAVWNGRLRLQRGCL